MWTVKVNVMRWKSVISGIMFMLWLLTIYQNILMAFVVTLWVIGGLYLFFSDVVDYKLKKKERGGRVGSKN